LLSLFTRSTLIFYHTVQFYDFVYENVYLVFHIIQLSFVFRSWFFRAIRLKCKIEALFLSEQANNEINKSKLLLDDQLKLLDFLPIFNEHNLLFDLNRNVLLKNCNGNPVILFIENALLGYYSLMVNAGAISVFRLFVV